jgi:tocopherol O-methyltransferase
MDNFSAMVTSTQPHAPADVAAHYDELDYFYRDVWGEHVHHGLWRTGREDRAVAVRQLAELVAEEAELSAGSRVCDIGCGYGATARLIAEKFGAEVTAITVSAAQHAFAEATAARSEGRSPAYLLGDWLENTLLDKSFDAAIAIESSEHMPDLAGFFRQAHRVLKTGGRLVVCAWLSRESPTDWQRKWLLEPICREGRMPAVGTASDYERLARETGFEVVRVQDITQKVASTWPRIAWTFFVKLLAQPRYLRFLLNPHAHNRVFAVTIFRIWVAYQTGAMKYGVFTLTRRAE